MDIKPCQESSSLVKLDKNNMQFTWRPTNCFEYISYWR